MSLEYIITKEEIREINRRCGGSVRSDAEIETALYRGKGRGSYRKIAYLWKAILVGHPFTDGNKRTAVMTACVILKRSGIRVTERTKYKLAETAGRIAIGDVENINRIERMVRYAVTRH